MEEEEGISILLKPSRGDVILLRECCIIDLQLDEYYLTVFEYMIVSMSLNYHIVLHNYVTTWHVITHLRININVY